MNEYENHNIDYLNGSFEFRETNDFILKNNRQ